MLERKMKNVKQNKMWLLKAALYFFVFTFHFVPLKAQNHTIDSLHKALKALQDDTGKVSTLNRLSIKLLDAGQYDSSLVYNGKTIALAEKLDFKRGLAKAYAICGDNYAYKDNYPKILENDLKALALYQELGDKKAIASINGSIGNAYWNQGNYPTALECDFKALAINQEIGNKSGIAVSLAGIGTIYMDQGNDAKALEYYIKAMNMNKELGNKNALANNYCNVGNAYYDLGNRTMGLEFYFKALALKIKLDDKRGIARNCGNIGNIYEDMGDYKQALEYEFRALDIDQKVGYKKGTVSKMTSIGSIYTRLKDFKKSRLYLDSALHVAQRIGEKEYTKGALSELSHLDEVSGNYKEAFGDYKTYIAYRDSLTNASNTRKIVQSEMNFEFEQKQAAEKAERDKKDAVSAQELKKQLIIRNAFIAGFALMLALAFFIFRSYWQKHKDNQIINRQKILVEKKQKEVVSSIHYAQQIQKALLASDSLLGKYLPEYFVLYRPKDIVSGDFYWGTAKDNRFYLAVCDSTGHGVPGAFMSLLNISFMNEAITEKNIMKPNEVLNHTRKRLIEKVSQDGSQDGMDGTLISLPVNSLANGELIYSGAYNAPLIIRDGKIIELPVDKLPVGASPKDYISFTASTFNLQKGDIIYAFTDGYADQFGGPKGKKFKYRQFTETLLATAKLTMEEQKKKLEEILDEWKGLMEQVDDILVIGVRV